MCRYENGWGVRRTIDKDLPLIDSSSYPCRQKLRFETASVSVVGRVPGWENEKGFSTISTTTTTTVSLPSSSDSTVLVPFYLTHSDVKRFRMWF